MDTDRRSVLKSIAAVLVMPFSWIGSKPTNKLDLRAPSVSLRGYSGGVEIQKPEDHPNWQRVPELFDEYPFEGCGAELISSDWTKIDGEEFHWEAWNVGDENKTKVATLNREVRLISLPD